jgi:hypothetical protein
MSIEKQTLVHFRHFSSLLTIFPSTLVERALQIHPFLCKTNPISKKSSERMYIYINELCKLDTWSIRKNEPKTNPNEPNSKKVKMNASKVLTMDYENISNWPICENEPNSNPIKANLPNAEMNVTYFLTKELRTMICEPRTDNYELIQPNPTCSDLARPEHTRRDRTCFKGKKMCLDAPKILTITNIDDNFKKCTVFRLFIERTLFGR